MNHEVEHDLQELEKLNTTFVAAASAKQEEHGFSKREHSATSDVIDSRPFEDELGELLLQELQNLQVNPSSDVFSEVPSVPHASQSQQVWSFETIIASKFNRTCH